MDEKQADGYNRWDHFWMGLRAMDGESQSCEGERGSWRTTQFQNRVEQLTGLLPVGLGPSLV